MTYEEAVELFYNNEKVQEQFDFWQIKIIEINETKIKQLINLYEIEKNDLTEEELDIVEAYQYN